MGVLSSSQKRMKTAGACVIALTIGVLIGRMGMTGDDGALLQEQMAKEKQLNTLQIAQAEMSKTVVEHEARHAALENSYRSQIEDLESTVADLTKEVTTLSETNKDLESQLEAANEARKAVESDLKSIANQNELVSGLSAEVSHLTAKNKHLENQLNATDTMHSAIGRQLNSTLDSHELMEVELQAVSAERDLLRQKLGSCRQAAANSTQSSVSCKPCKQISLHSQIEKIPTRKVNTMFPSLLEHQNLSHVPGLKKFNLENLARVYNATRKNNLLYECGILVSILENRVFFKLVPRHCARLIHAWETHAYAPRTLEALSAMVARERVPDVMFIIKFVDGCKQNWKGKVPILSHNVAPGCKWHIPFPSYDWYWHDANEFKLRSPGRFDSFPLTPWAARVSKAVWAGRVGGYTHNLRPRILYFGGNHSDLLNVSATDCEDYGGTKGDGILCRWMEPGDIMKHKYVVDVEGFGVTFRLKNLLLSGSVVPNPN